LNQRLHLALLRGAALLVRAPEREEWLAEWRAELWYVGPPRRTAFCLGAFPDAFWLRRNGPAPVYLQSPWHCLAVLATLAACSAGLAFQLPLSRQFLLAPQLPAGTMTISGIPLEDYRQLSVDPSRSAFYGPPRFQAGSLNVALASRNLFDVLNVPLAPAIAPLVIASGDPRLIGQHLTVAGRTAQIAAILSENVWQLPGPANAWLLVDDQTLATESWGYAVAQMNRPTTYVSVLHTAGSVNRFICVPLAERRLLIAFLMMIGVGGLVLPAVTSLSLGEYPGSHGRRWIFLAAKFAFVLPIVLFGSLDLFSLIAIHLEAHAMIVGSVIGFRWVLIDQRRRCPVCLRTLTNPTTIGEPSRTLLEWYGTELICTKGHGLLHVPELRNSYSEQRWLRLDSSWSGLF
jgi:hypothetical protein